MGRQINVQIIGDAENVPRGMRAAGATCDGRGRYIMAFNPQTGAVVLARKDKGGIFTLHTGHTVKEPSKVVSEAKVVDAITRTVTSYKTTVGPVALKGRWSAHIACEAAGPQLVIRRNFTGYATLAVVSHLDGKWEFAVGTTDRWFTGASSTSKGGFTSFNAAMRAGMKSLDLRVAEACRVEHVGMNPASKGAAKKKATNAKKAAKTQRKIVGKTQKAKQTVRAAAAKAKIKKAAKKPAAKKAAKKVSKKLIAARRVERMKSKIPKRFLSMMGKNVAVKSGTNKGAEGKVTDVHTRAPGGAIKVAGHASGPVIEIQINGHKIGVRAFDKNGKLSVRQLKRAPKSLEKQIKATERATKKASGGKKVKAAPGASALMKLEKAQKKAMEKLEKAQKKAAVYAEKQRKMAMKAATKAEREAKTLERAAMRMAKGKGKGKAVVPKAKTNGNGKKVVAKTKTNGNGKKGVAAPRRQAPQPSYQPMAAAGSDAEFEAALAALTAQAGMR
jgi:hypothetical protein